MSLPTRPTRDVPLNLYRVSSPATARVIENRRLTPVANDDVRHIVLSLEGLDYHYLEGQSLGVLTPDAKGSGLFNKLRLYSIASSRMGDDGTGQTASICVKRVVTRDPVTGEEFRGVASNYLCDLQPGDQVAITGPAGKTFLLPDDPGANLILVATGTGIAPYRAFLRRIYHELPNWSGSVHLFFGVKTAAECLYRDELDSYRDRPGFHVGYAFSREETTADGQRVYVHHRIGERIESVWPLVHRPDSYLFICGIKGMEDHIAKTLEVRAGVDGVVWDSFQKALRDEGRLLIETY